MDIDIAICCFVLALVSGTLAYCATSWRSPEGIPPCDMKPSGLQPGIADSKSIEIIGRSEPLLSDEEMTISGEIPLMSEEELRQLETQPIPVEEGAPELRGMVRRGEGPPDSAAPAGTFYSDINTYETWYNRNGEADGWVRVGEVTDPQDDARKRMADFNLGDVVKMLRSQMLTPLDYEFPARMAVVDAPGCQAIPVAFVGQRIPRGELVIQPRSDGDTWEGQTFAWHPDCSRCEAFLFVRPFLRLLWPQEDWALDQLRTLRGTVKIGDEIIADQVPVDSWIVKPDGQGLTALPFKFIPRGTPLALWGHEYDPEPQQRAMHLPGQLAAGVVGGFVGAAPPRTPEPPQVGAPLGPAVSDEHGVTVHLSGFPVGAIRVEVGCLMGLYSTTP